MIQAYSAIGIRCCGDSAEAKSKLVYLHSSRCLLSVTKNRKNSLSWCFRCGPRLQNDVITLLYIPYKNFTRHVPQSHCDLINFIRDHMYFICHHINFTVIICEIFTFDISHVIICDFGTYHVEFCKVNQSNVFVTDLKYHC